MRLVTQLTSVLILSMALQGCTTISKVKVESEHTNIVYFNGINKFEAKIIAERTLLHSDYTSYFNVVPALVREDSEAQKYPEHWFVDFSPRKLFDAPSFLVVIRKDNGDVLLAKEYFPHKITNLQWVFERTKNLPKSE